VGASTALTGGALAAGAGSIAPLALGGTAGGLSVGAGAAAAGGGGFLASLGSLSAPLSIASGLLSAGVAIQQGNATAKQAEMLAEQEREAARSELQGAQERIKAVLSFNRADAGARGLDMSSGSQGILESRNASDFLQEAGDISRGSRRRLSVFNAARSNARRSGRLRAAATLFDTGNEAFQRVL
jgi:hypothetical protein